MKKFKKYFLPVLFAFAIVFIALATYLLPPKEYSENEKRMLSTFPKFSMEALNSGEFQDGLEKYISDHIFGRDFFVGVSSYFDMLLGKNSLGSIYNCDDGYLINAPKAGEEGFFEDNMKNIQDFTEKSGIDSTLMIIPTSGYIMEDKLPAFHGKYRDAELFNLASELTPALKFVDVRGDIAREYAEGRQMYYRTDHHLTSEGSYRVYKTFCEFGSLHCPEKSSYKVDSYDGFRGTTYSGSGYFLNNDDTLEIWDIGLDVTVTLEEKDSKKSDTMFFTEHLDNMDMYPVYLDGNHGYVHIHNPHGKSGNLLVIRDSFAQNLAPFLAYNYENIYMLDMRYYRNSMMTFLEDKDIGEILYVYGLDTLVTDKSTSWLLF